jgi:hypothetical protein
LLISVIVKKASGSFLPEALGNTSVARYEQIGSGHLYQVMAIRKGALSGFT